MIMGSDKRAIAIASLSAGKTRREAAEDAGIGETTLYRWLSDSAFSEELSQRRNAVLRAATAQLSGIVEDAIGTLQRAMTGEKLPGIAVTAADKTIKNAVAMAQTVAMSDELSLLRQRLEAMEEASARGDTG